jgi:hypothetical protein
MAFFRGPSVVLDGLVLYLDAANPDSYSGTGSTWLDVSGNANNGTLTNGPTFDSGNKGSISFDGINDYITTGNLITNSDFPDNNYTLTCWFNWNGIVGGNDGRAYLLQNGGSNFPLTLEINSRDFTPARFATWEHTTNGQIQLNSNVVVDTNRWYYFVVSKGISNTIKMFVDSDEIFSTTSIGGNLLSFSGVRIGTYRSANNRWFGGNISQVQIYNRALSAEEILQNFNSTKSRFGI